MAGGRPTDYRPEFCAKVVELGRQGKSRAQIAAQLDIARSNLEIWMQKHPEFQEAMDKAKDLELAWFEDWAQKGITGEAQVNAPLWSRSAAARFPKDYTERKQTELTGANGGPVQVAHSTLTEAELDERIAALSKATGIG